ncbi:restriction endonuclease [Actinomycetaceae bacterium L2_0104]
MKLFVDTIVLDLMRGQPMAEMPTWEGFLIPTLRVVSDGVVRDRRTIYSLSARAAGLDDQQMQETLASGHLKYRNRIGWGLSFLVNVGALDRPSRGRYAITDAGKQLLTRFPDGVSQKDIDALGADPSIRIRPYVATVSRKSQPEQQLEESATMTPIEQVQDGVSRIHDDVAAELLKRLQEREPEFFESAVVNLLLAMGYGGTAGSGSVTALTNDGGIDGVIDQDVLGLSKVYIQAKRYGVGNSVQRPEVQAFVGALSGKADSGVFITTSVFSAGARAYAEGVPLRIVLIDGKRLSDLMIRYGVGVQIRETYSIVEIDEDFFA